MAEPLRSQEELNKLLSEGAKPQPVQAPSFYVTSIRITFEPTNVSLTFAKSQPVDIPVGNDLVHAAALAPVVVLDMSPQTAKDLLVLLKDQVDTHEMNWGNIETDFTRRRAGKK